MSLKDIKAILKEAREAIKNKDFQTSLKLSKIILRDDKENYMALIFLGFSLQEIGPIEQAPNAFKKAIQVNPNNPLAWNGLANYYEKSNNEEAQKQLIQIHITLLGIETTEKKVNEVCQKLCLLSIPEENLVNAVESLYKIANKTIYTKETNTSAWLAIVNIISKIPTFDSSLLDIYEKAIFVVLSNPHLATRQHYVEYIKLLYKGKKYEDLFEISKKMFDLYGTDLTSIEWACKVYNELVIEENNIISDKQIEIQNYCDIMLRINADSSIALFTKGVLAFIDNDLQEAKELLRQVTTLRSGLLHAWVLLAHCEMNLYLYDDASFAALKADKLLHNIDDVNKVLRKKVDTLLLETLSRTSENETLEKGIEICTTFINEGTINSEIYRSLTRCYINLENFSQAKLSLSKLQEFTKEILLEAQLLHKEGNTSKAIELLETEETSNNPEWWFELALLYWECGSFEKSLVPFLKAAKLAPNCYLYYLHLGHYYTKFNNSDKARRCYEKAYKLNTKFVDAAAELSKIYRSQKNWDANVILLENVTEGILNTENHWAWLQLGLNYLEREDYSRAIDTLRFVVRANPDKSHCWESLADAYMARGAYTSALKCYQKCLEITPNLLYPLFQIANIKQILGEFTEARTDYDVILSTNKCYVPALKGLAETCLLQAKQYRKNQMIGLARDHAQTALDTITIGLQKRNDLSCLWKLAGDSCYFVTKLSERYCCMLVLTELADGQPIKGNKALEQEELYVLAERCYHKALTLVKDKALIWHDLASCYLSHSCNCKNKEHAEELLKKSMDIVQCCISLNSTNWQHWNLMGVIALKKEPKDYALGQHCFIKAIMAEDNSAVSWCNLGTLYLTLGDLKLANQAFSQAQRADPNYVNSWVGQALIAESVGLDDAMDLFRHSTQLGARQQGGIGYGYWVCRTLLESPSNSVLYSIHNMHAVPVACDALTWYTENDPNDACAWNMLGLLKERMGLKLGAAQAFRNSLRLCEQQYRDKARINYGRVLFKLEKYEQAVDMFKDIEKATFNSGSGLALSLFKDQQYEESYETYDQALHWLTDEQSLQSDLLVALASMAYMFQGPDVAKTLLFQSTQLKLPSPHGFYATLALGLLHKDINLTKLVFKELHNLKDEPHCLHHYGVLLCYTHLIMGEQEKAVRELSKLVHRYPNYASLWLTLSILLLRLYKTRPKSIKAAANCAQLAIKLGRANMDITKILCVVSLAAYLVDDYKEALISAQKAVHCYPDAAESWAALICALLVYKKKSTVLNEKLWISKAAIYVKEDLDASSLITDWINNQNLSENQ